MTHKNIFQIRFLAAVMFLSIICCSCKKFLDKSPDNSVAVPQSLSELQALLDYTFRMNLQTTPNFGESSADDYFLLETTFNSLDVGEQSIYYWQRPAYGSSSDWGRGYFPVYTANYCLEQIQKIPPAASNTSDWNNVYGSSLFYRSYNLLHLLWTFAKAYDENTSGQDLGIVLKTSSDFNERSIRSTVTDCYNFILRDAKGAAGLLPGLPAFPTRPSKAAAYGLLARTYLSMRVYDSAYKYADLCLSIKNDLINFNGDPDINGSLASATPFKPYNKETLFYSEMTTADFTGSPGQAKIDTVLYGFYAADDLRKTGYFEANSGYYKFKGSYTGTAWQYFSGIATDEMYLIRAECLARKNNITAAMKDLNHLLKSRWKASSDYTDLNAASGTEALQIVLKERRKELLARGLRWIDIKRLNKEGANITIRRKIAGKEYTLEPNSPKYALPLPDDIIRENNMEQN